MDYTTEVRAEQEYLEVAAQVTITGDGDFYLDWWDVEGKTMYREDCPSKLQELLFELAEDNMREDV